MSYACMDGRLASGNMEAELHTGVRMAQPRKSEHPMPVAVFHATVVGEISHDEIKTSGGGGDAGRRDRNACDGAGSAAGTWRLQGGSPMGERLSLSIRTLRLLAGRRRSGCDRWRDRNGRCDRNGAVPRRLSLRL